MALRTALREPPQGAITLTTDEALKYQWDQISNWKNKWEVWPFKYGLPAIVGIGGLSGLRINTLVRRKLKLRNFGLFPSAMAVGLASFVFVGFGQYCVVLPKILTYQAQCPVCILTTAIGIQLGGGVIYPMATGPFANFVMVNRYLPVRMPHWGDTKAIMQLWLETIRPFRKNITILAIMNVLAAGYITFSQNESLYNMRMKLIMEAAERKGEELEIPDRELILYGIEKR